MELVTNPNWFIVLGLIFMLFSLIFMGSAIGSDGVRYRDGDRRTFGMRGFQRVSLSMTIGLLAIGLVLELLGQVVIATMSAPIALAMIGLAFALLMFGMVADLIGAKLDVADRPMGALAPGDTPTPVDIRDLDARRGAERLRMAG